MSRFLTPFLSTIALTINRQRRRRVLAAMIAPALLGGSVLLAAPYYWDINDVTAGSGGLMPTGQWNLTNASWNSSATGEATPPVAWENSGGDLAVLAAGADATGNYAVTLSAGVAINLSGITLEEGNVTLAVADPVNDSLNFGAVVAAFDIALNSILTLNAASAGTLGLTKTGAGMLRLGTGSAPTGAYAVSSGELRLDDGLTLVVTTLTVGGGGAGTSSLVTLGTGSVLNLGGNLSFTNTGNPLTALVQGGTLNLHGTRSIVVPNSTAQEADLEIRSVIADGSTPSGLTKTGTGGGLVLKGANTYTGPTVVAANSGTLFVQGHAGSIASSSSITVHASSTLTVGSTGDTVAVDRIGNTASITLNAGVGGGNVNFNYVGSDFSAPAVHAETVGALTVAGDARSFVTLIPGAGDEVTLTVAALSRQGNGIGTIRGNNLGFAPGTADSVRVFATQAPALFGGAGGSGTATAGIVPWLLGDGSAAGVGSGFLTYDATLGLRLLTASETVAPAAAAAHTNVLKSVGGAAAINGSVQVNSWTTANTGTVTLGSGITLGLKSGGLLFTTTGTLTGGTLDVATYTQGIVQLASGVAVTATINSVITGDSGLLFGGSGSGNKVLVLGGTNTFTGGATVLQGILQLNSAGALNAAGTNILSALGGTVRLNGNSIAVAGLSGDGIVNNNSASGAVILRVNGGGSFTGTLVDGSTAALGLAKAGVDPLILGGVNTYTGTTVVEQGTLHVNQAGAAAGTAGRLTATASLLIRQGGTLQINNGNLNNSNADRVNNAASITLAGGALIYNHPGIINVGYSETLGVLSLIAGANQITTSPANATGGTATLTFSNFATRPVGATLNFSGGGLGVTLRNQVLFTSGITAGVIGGWATVESEFAKSVAGSGVTALVAADYTTTNANDGTTPWSNAVNAKPATSQTATHLATSSELNSLNLASGISLTQTAGTVINLFSGGLIKQVGSVNGTGSAVSAISGGTLTAGGTAATAELFVRVTGANLTVSSIIADNPGDGVTAGQVSLVKSGLGKIVLNASNTYTGHTYFNEGTIQAGALNRFGAGASRQLIFNGGILQFSGVFDLSTLPTVFNGAATFDTQANNLTLANAIGNGGAGSFTKAGTGTLNLAAATNALNYAGRTTVTSGTIVFAGSGATHQLNDLVLGGTAATDAATVNIGAGNILTLAGNVSYDSSNNALPGTIQNGTLVLNGVRSFAIGDSTNGAAATDLNLSALIADGTFVSSLLKTGAGTLALTGANTYSGRTEVQNGVLSFTSISALGGGSSALGAVSNAVEATISLGKGADTGALAYVGAGPAASNRAIALNAETGGGRIIANGGGALSLSGDIGSAQTGAKTLFLDGSSASAIVNTLSGAISDDASVQAAVSVSKQGTNTWALDGISNYAGPTTVSGGTLLVNGMVNGTSGLSVKVGGTLGGVGTISTRSNGHAVVESGGSLAPGISVGTLTLALGTGQLDVSAAAGSSGWLKFELGTSSDQIRLLSGTFNLGNLGGLPGGLDLDDFVFADSGGFGSGSYLLVDTSAEMIGELGSNVSGQILGYNVELSFAQGANGRQDLVLNVGTAVPEPGVAFSLLGGWGLLLGLQRRRKS